MDPVNFLFMTRLSLDLQNEEVNLKIRRNLEENFGQVPPLSNSSRAGNTCTVLAFQLVCVWRKYYTQCSTSYVLLSLQGKFLSCNRLFESILSTTSCCFTQTEFGIVL